MEKGIVGLENAIDGFGSELFAEPIGEKRLARQLRPHNPVTAENLFEKRMGEEDEPLTYRKTSAAFAVNEDRLRFEIDVVNVYSLQFRSSQATADTESEDAQISSVNKQGELVSFFVFHQISVMLVHTSQQLHQLEGRRQSLYSISVSGLDVEPLHRVGVDEPAQPHRVEESLEHHLHDLEGELFVVPGVVEIGEVALNTACVYFSDRSSRLLPFQPPVKKAQMPVVVSHGLVSQLLFLYIACYKDSDTFIDRR